MNIINIIKASFFLWLSLLVILEFSLNSLLVQRVASAEAAEAAAAEAAEAAEAAGTMR